MKRSIFSVLLGVGLSAVGIFLAARYVQEPPSIALYWPIAVGVAATLMAWLLQGTILALLSRPQLGSVEILDMTRVYLATQAAGAVTPFAGGEVAYQLLELNRRGLSPGMGGAVITLKSVLNGSVLYAGVIAAFFIVPDLPFVESPPELPFSATTILVGAAIVVAAILALIAALLVVGRRARRREERGRLGSIFAKIPYYRRRAKDYVRDLRESLRTIWRQEPRVVLGCLGLMMLYWAIYPLLGTMALRAAGWDGTGWLGVYMAQFILYSFIPLAPTPGNSGAAELAFVALMGNYVTQSALLSGVIVWRVLNHYSEQVIGGFIAGRQLPEDIKIARREFDSDGSG